MLLLSQVQNVSNRTKMEPNAFVAEVYRRMSLRLAMEKATSEPVPPTPERVAQVVREYRAVLPADKQSRILDIGYGDGWFMAACRQLGYKNVCGADFNPTRKTYMQSWDVTLYDRKDIGDLLKNHPEQFDFIHMSHVIEHIHKYSLLWIGDALYQALKKGGTLYLRTPNMEGPTPNSSYYVTLAHEYGLRLQAKVVFEHLRLCLNPVFPPPPAYAGTAVQLLLKWPFHRVLRIKHGISLRPRRSKAFASRLVTAKHAEVRAKQAESRAKSPPAHLIVSIHPKRQQHIPRHSI